MANLNSERPCPFCKAPVIDGISRCTVCGHDLTAAEISADIFISSDIPRRRRRNRSTLIAGAIILLLCIPVGRYVLHERAMRGELVGLANALGSADTEIVTITVPASSTWVTAPGAVTTDDYLYFIETTGSWRIKDGCPFTDAEGHRGDTCLLTAAERERGIVGSILAKERPGALLWRPDTITNGAFVVLIEGLPAPIPRNGRLQFRINDDYLDDNEGSVELRYAVTRH